LNEFEDENYVVLFKEFGNDSGVNLRANFVKVCERLDGCD